jgi:hypothetical protein
VLREAEFSAFTEKTVRLKMIELDRWESMILKPDVIRKPRQARNELE